MMTSAIRTVVRAHCVVAVAIAAVTTHAIAQQPASLTLAQARALARQSSPALAAAQADVDAAAARQRQTGAFPNPNLSYSHEQTSGEGLETSQYIATLDQRLDITGQRGARMQAARLRHEAARTRLVVAQLELDRDVARAYIALNRAARRAALAASAARQFARAAQIMTRRLEQGDVSGYAVRRIRLESARYAAMAAEAQLEERDARLRLELLSGSTTDTVVTAIQAIAHPALTSTVRSESIVTAALARSADIRVLDLEVRAAEAAARAAAREAIPVPSLFAGLKNERTTSDEHLSGFTAGVTLALPLWDRRSGATAAARAEAGRREAEREAVRRSTQRSIEVALDAVRSADRQLAALEPELGDESRAALQAAEIAYAEGEITLVEWLDAVRAYQEAEAAYASILAESYTQRAALERVLGIQLLQ